MALREMLMAEILRVRGDSADIQVYEDTRGAVGDSIIQTGEMLSLDLGPGILAQIYDGYKTPGALGTDPWQIPQARRSGRCTR